VFDTLEYIPLEESKNGKQINLFEEMSDEEFDWVQEGFIAQ